MKKLYLTLLIGKFIALKQRLMLMAIKIMAGIIALEHLYILWLEMFAWTTKGPKTFKSLPPHLFEPTKALAGNQGLYNGFLSAGLIWSLMVQDEAWSINIATFFMACVAIAGVYGAATAGKRIFFVQAVPALIGLLLVVLHYTML